MPNLSDAARARAGKLCLSLAAVALATASAASAGCSAKAAAPDGSSSGTSGSSSGTSGTSGTSGSSGTSGTSGSSGTSGTSGSSGTSGTSGTSGSPAGALPAGTVLYVRAETADHDLLIARDLKAGTERVVTDLRGDGSAGWEIWGYSLSPDRTRIALASLYGPTKADTDTGLATRAIWSLATNGTDFRRLTPTFPNTGGGKTNFTISIEDPMFTADGNAVLFDEGNYWYEGTTLKGGSFPWSVAAAGGALPAAYSTIQTCSVLNPSRNPATGEMLFRHSVCISSQDEGLFLYPPAGGTSPKKLVQQSSAAGGVDPSLETASWVSDGSAFVFVGLTQVTRGTATETANCLFLYDMAKATVSTLVVPPAGEYVRNAAVAPDATSIVYCLEAADHTQNLHLIDLTPAQPTDTAITTDGKSCRPTF